MPTLAKVTYQGDCEWCGAWIKEQKDCHIIQQRYEPDPGEAPNNQTVYTRLCKGCSNIYHKLGRK